MQVVICCFLYVFCYDYFVVIFFAERMVWDGNETLYAR